MNHIINTAAEKGQDLMTSKFMELEEDRHPKFSEEYQKGYETVVLLEKDLQGAVMLDWLLSTGTQLHTVSSAPMDHSKSAGHQNMLPCFAQSGCFRCHELLQTSSSENLV